MCRPHTLASGNLFDRDLLRSVCARAAVLSGGEQQMLAIGRALMAKPTLMLIDEPSIGLGASGARRRRPLPKPCAASPSSMRSKVDPRAHRQTAPQRA
jgi:ABC-type uncharacterized transport system ATPase subunit